MKAFAKKPADISAKAMEHYGRLVLKVAYRIVPNADQAQEIFQETFLRFHAACTRGKVIAYPKAWLRRVATNVAFNARRQQRGAEGRGEGDSHLLSLVHCRSAATSRPSLGHHRYS